MAYLKTTEIREEGTFGQLILPTIEIFPLFFFGVFRQRKYMFSLIITTENFYCKLLIKLQKSCYTPALLENFFATLQRNFVISLHPAHFCSLYVNFFSVLIIGLFRKQLSCPSYSKAGYLNVPNQPLNHQGQPLSHTQARNHISVFLNHFVSKKLTQSVVVSSFQLSDTMTCSRVTKSLNGHSHWTT